MNELPTGQLEARIQPSTETGKPPMVDSQHLFGVSNRLVIRHDKRNYLLQITRQGKLILTR